VSGLIFDCKNIDFRGVKVDCHLHTAYTDGEPTVDQIYRRSSLLGLDEILFSEHSRQSSVSWFPKFAEEVRRCSGLGVSVNVGTEVKVLDNFGNIDLAPEIEALCDYVMVSVHRMVDKRGVIRQFDEMARRDVLDIEKALSIAAIEQSGDRFQILGHMFGMSLKRFGLDVPRSVVEDVVICATENSVAIELNSGYHTNAAMIFDVCRSAGAQITFGSNAHTLENVGSTIGMIQELSDLFGGQT